MPGRVACCVPFCRHTRGIRKGEPGLPSEWLCADHWRLVPRAVRMFKHRCGRAAFAATDRRLALRDTAAPEEDRKACAKVDHAWARAIRSWERCKRAAIEGALGL